MPTDDRLDKARNLVHADAAAVVRTVATASVSPTPADLDSEGMAFEGEAYRYTSEWLKSHPNQSSTTPFAFVLCRSVQQAEDIAKANGASIHSRLHAFRSQKTVKVEGHILLTTLNFEYAAAIAVSNAVNPQAIFDAIQQLGLHDRHLALFEPSQSNLILMRSGLSGSSRAQTVLATGTQTPWSLADLENEIIQFHNDHTRTPTSVLVPWSDAKKGVTGEKLELRISKALAHYLDLRWQRGSVMAEAECASGRMDVYVTREVLQPGLGPGVVEIKVWRSRHNRREAGGDYRKVSPKFTLAWAKKGVAQAHLYRQDISAHTGMLCSFDARDKNAELPDVDQYAKSMSIRHKRLFMFRSGSDLQESVLISTGGKA
jgi:hypothetical protein